MEANKRKITDIFNGSRLLKVPFFQRTYVWKEEQWQRMLSDMEYITSEYRLEEHGYFLGSIILKQENSTTDEHIADIRTIVDGQQRLTTIAILLKVLYLLTDEDRKFKRKFCLDDDDETVAIKHSHVDNTGFEEVMKLTKIQNIEEKSGITAAYNFFKENIVVERLNVDSIMKNVLFVVIDLNANEDEQLIFDTINSLGVRLTTGELLKNYFYKEGTIDKYNRYWKPVFDESEDCINYWNHKMTTGRIKKNFTESFFYSYLQVKTQLPELNLSTEAKKVYRRTEGLFNNYKTLANDKQLNLEEFAQEITNYGRLFKNAFTLGTEKQMIPSYSCVQRINFIIFTLDVSTLFPYVMYILKNVPEIDEQNKIFGYIESYVMRRFVCDEKNNNYSDLFSENLIGQKVKSIDALQDYISKKDAASSLAMPSDAKVQSCIRTTEFINKKALAILYLLESKMRESKKHALELLPFADYTLEHLFPRNWQTNWKPSPNRTPEELESLIVTLGNMAMIPSKLNTSISNSNWKVKLNGRQDDDGLSVYAKGLLTMNKALQSTDWNEDAILRRNDELAGYILSVWK